MPISNSVNTNLSCPEDLPYTWSWLESAVQYTGIHLAMLQRTKLPRTELPSGKFVWVNNRVLRICDGCGDLPCRWLWSPGCSLQL